MPYLGDEAVDDARFYEDLLEIYSGRVDGAAALVAQKTRAPAGNSSSVVTSSAAADPVPVAPPSSSDADLKSSVGAEEEQQRSTAASGNKRGRRSRANARQNTAEKLNATIGSATSAGEPPLKRGRRCSLAATKSNGSGSTALQVSAQCPARSMQMQLSLKALDDFTLSDLVEFLYTRFDDWANFEPPVPSATGSNALDGTLEQQQKQKATVDEGVECVDEAAIFKPTPNDIAIAPMAAAPLSLFFSIASLVERSSKVNHYAILRRYFFFLFDMLRRITIYCLIHSSIVYFFLLQ